MPIRKVLLYVMLGSLAVAAVGGAAAILVVNESGIWRVIGTAITTAVASGILYRLSTFIDKKETRSAGMAGMLLLLVEFFLVLALIWEVPRMISGGWRGEERVGMTALFLFLTGMGATLSLRLANVKVAGLAGRLGVGFSAAAFVVLMVGTWGWAEHSSIFEKWLGTGATAGGLGLTTVAALVGLGFDRWHWRWAGIAAGAVAAAMLMYGIWFNTGGGPFIVTCIGGIAFLVGYINVAMRCPLVGAQKWALVATIGAVAALVGCVDGLAYLDQTHGSNDFLERLTGASSIMAGCGSIALLVLARINRKPETMPELGTVKEMTLVCPGCQTKQAVGLPDSRCRTCGLRFRIEVQEPRCPNCNYLLYMLKSDRCPECGTAVETGGTSGAVG